MKQLRIDDIGASTKVFEQYGKKWFFWKNKAIFYFPFANWLFFKRLWPWRGWGPYAEVSAELWQELLTVLRVKKIVPLIAITASWVEKDGTRTPFPQKFPAAAAVLKAALQSGDIRIANHGLTHCVVGKHLPKMFGSNRASHREFLESVSEQEQREHILESQKILENYFEAPISILVPPGNVWCAKTARAMVGTNLETIICGRPAAQGSDVPLPTGIQFILDKNDFICIHDRELQQWGASGFNTFLDSHYA